MHRGHYDYLLTARASAVVRFRSTPALSANSGGQRLIRDGLGPLLEALDAAETGGDAVTREVAGETLSVVPLFAVDGGVEGVLAVAEPMERVPRLMHELQAGTRHFSRVIHHVPHVVLTARPGGTIDYLSRRWEALVAARSGRRVRDPHREFFEGIAPGYMDAARARWLQGVGRNVAFRFRTRLATREGDRWFELQAEPMTSGTRVMKWIATLTDIQERVLELAALRRRVTTAQEDERKRLSRELHDQVGQYVTAIGLGLQRLTTMTPDPVLRRDVGRLLELTSDLGREVHELAVHLRPRELDDYGLAAALESYVNDWSRSAEINAAVDVRLDGGRLPEAIELALFRIVQEALTNVARHSRAANAGIILERRGTEVVLVVEDDGVGMVADDEAPPSGLGLLGMRERAHALDGSLAIETSPAGGTAVFVRVPIEAQPG